MTTWHGYTPGQVTPIEKGQGTRRVLTHTITNNRPRFVAVGAKDQALGTKAIAAPHSFTLTAFTDGARISSKLLAQGLANKHRHVIALIDKYLDRFKSFGQVLFKKAVGERTHGGGNAERYALLNEDQAYFLLSLSRNSDTVVNLKAKLIRIFGQYRKVADLRKTEYLPAYHDLHDKLHELAAGSSHERHVHLNVNRLLNKFAGIEAGQRANAALPSQALLIVGQLVASKTAQDAIDQHDGYQRIKTTLQGLQRTLALDVEGHE